MPFTAITTEQVAVDAPYTSELGTTIKEDLDYLNANVAAPTDVSNGGFEVDNDSDDVPDNWTVDHYTGGTSAFNTTTPFEGAQSFQFTHPGGAGNGGGYIESGYLTISEYVSPMVQFALKCSAAGTKVVCRLRYFDKDKNDLSSDEDIYSSTTNPTAWTMKTLWGIPPATSRYMKIRLIGGLNDTDVTGTVDFDAVRYDPFPKVLYDDFTIAAGDTNAASYTDQNSATIKVPKGFTAALIPIDFNFYDTGGVGGIIYAGARYKIGTTYSTTVLERTERSASWTDPSYGKGIVELDISVLSGSQTLVAQGLVVGVSANDHILVSKTESIATYIRQGI
jgi:hypothetical protein